MADDHYADLFGRLFGREPRRETRYGFLTDAEYQRRLDMGRAKDQAIRDCALCDVDGYRNLYLCNHTDNSSRENRKKRFRVVR